MKLSKDTLKSLLEKPRISPDEKNIYSICPWCGKDKFGVSIVNENNPFGCFRVECAETGTIFKLLKKLNRLDLLGQSRQVDIFSRVENNFKDIEEAQNLEVEEVPMPYGFKRIEYHPYLESRGFSDEDYEKYQAGITKINPSYKDYILFTVINGGKIVGYFGRIPYTRSQLEEINLKRKREGKRELERYMNTSDVSFDKIILGLDELDEFTEVVVAVEGLFNKKKIDDYLLLNNLTNMKCIATLGSSISEFQIRLLLNKNFKIFILLYDADAILKIKKYSQKLMIYWSTFIIPLKDKEDLDDKKVEEIEELFDRIVSPSYFYYSKVIKKELK